MKNQISNILRKLNEYISPSGHERQLLEFVKSQICDFCDESYFDPIGNLIVKVGNECGERVMFSTHSDTIGLIVYAADDKGFLRVSNLGYIDLVSTLGRHVKFENGVDGVFTCEMGGEKKVSTCYVDIGAASKDEALSMVSVGDVCSVVGNVFHLGKQSSLVSAPFLDNRIAVACQILAIQKVFEFRLSLKNELYFVFSVQEELGLRGAGPAAYNINPKYGLACDVTAVSDSPESGHLSQKVGAGACIKLMDGSVYCNDRMVSFLRNVADENNIKYQNEILFSGGTDAGKIQQARGSMFVGGISIPTRYIHSPSEVADLDDCLNVIELIVSSCRRGFDFD